jgi:outer membrane protein assembly factor BamA
VGFYGVGINTSSSGRANYGFEQPYGSASLKIQPTRGRFMVRGGFEASRWDLKSGQGTAPSADEVYTPESAPGLGTTTTFLHTQATVGFDTRPSKDYARRGGFYGVTGHDYKDRDDAFGFQQVDYEAIQHIPILRESWVLSLHGLAQTSWGKGNQETPFYLLPSVGGGSTLRGFSSYRFTDHNSLLLQAEWRIMVNRYLDLAFFYDAGKVTARTSDLDLDGLKDNYGFGVRFHGPFATPLRLELAHSRETSLKFIFSSHASF